MKREWRVDRLGGGEQAEEGAGGEDQRQAGFAVRHRLHGGGLVHGSGFHARNVAANEHALDRGYLIEVKLLPLRTIKADETLQVPKKAAEKPVDFCPAARFSP